MADKGRVVITVDRQYGSGGRITSKRLAEELGIPFYDEEILKMTSEESAIGEQYFRLAESSISVWRMKKRAIICCTALWAASGTVWERPRPKS